MSVSSAGGAGVASSGISAFIIGQSKVTHQISTAAGRNGHKVHHASLALQHVAGDGAAAVVSGRLPGHGDHVVLVASAMTFMGIPGSVGGSLTTYCNGEHAAGRRADC